jgi:hypothetical protein
MEDGRPAVVTAPVEELLEALAQLGDVSWTRLAPLVRPVFHRRRPFPFPTPPAVTWIAPPGVSIGFAADVGPALVHIHVEALERWSLTCEEVRDVAFANLRTAVTVRKAWDLIREPIGPYATAAFQSREGWASTLLLVPDLIEHVFGPGERLFVAPMRDLLFGLPADAHLGFATWLTTQFEALDPNALCLEAFLWRNRRLTVVPLEREAAMA